jgi:hypothetical protein
MPESGDHIHDPVIRPARRTAKYSPTGNPFTRIEHIATFGAHGLTAVARRLKDPQAARTYNYMLMVSARELIIREKPDEVPTR